MIGGLLISCACSCLKNEIAGNAALSLVRPVCTMYARTRVLYIWARVKNATAMPFLTRTNARVRVLIVGTCGM